MGATYFDPEASPQPLSYYSRLLTQRLHCPLGSTIGLAVPKAQVFHDRRRFVSLLHFLLDTAMCRFPISFQDNLMVPQFLNFPGKFLGTMPMRKSFPGYHMIE